MRTNKIFIVLIAMLLVIITGCSSNIRNQEIKIQGNKIIVEKQVNGENNYELYSEIKDSKEVQNAKDILNSTKRENAKVDMIHPAEYKFHFEDTNIKTSGSDFELWISPNKDKVELVISSENKYAQLDKEKSEKIFKLITGKNLSEV